MYRLTARWLFAMVEERTGYGGIQILFFLEFNGMN